MELKDYFVIIGKRLWIIVITIIVLLSAVYYFTSSKPQSWDASLTLNVIKNKEESKDGQYQYDRYYAIQASSLFADTVTSWIADPSTITSIYSQANIALPSLSLDKLSKLFKTSKKPPATIFVTINSDNQDSAIKLLNATTKVVQDKSQKVELKNFSIESSNPVVIEHKVSIINNMIIGLFAALIISGALIIFVEYLNPSKK